MSMTHNEDRKWRNKAEKKAHDGGGTYCDKCSNHIMPSALRFADFDAMWGTWKCHDCLLDERAMSEVSA